MSDALALALSVVALMASGASWAYVIRTQRRIERMRGKR